jgi:hypothetical protein
MFRELVSKDWVDLVCDVEGIIYKLLQVGFMPT